MPTKSTGSWSYERIAGVALPFFSKFRQLGALSETDASPESSEVIR